MQRRESKITFNGKNNSNLRILEDEKDRGFTFIKNQMENGKWLVLLEDVTLIGKTIYKELQGYESNAVIATALKSIKMPDIDYKVLSDSLIEKYPNDIRVDSKKDRIVSSKPCSSFELGNLTFRIAGLYYRIPQPFYTEDSEDGVCSFLFERNDEYRVADNIKSDDGKRDVDTNNGYILGLPFLRSFMVFLNFEENKIGFANKL